MCVRALLQPSLKTRVDRLTERVRVRVSLVLAMATAMGEPPDSSTTLTDETTSANTTNTIIAAFDPTLLIEYLTDLAVVILNASREDLQVSLLSYPDTLQRCSRFATDLNNLVLYLRKEVGEGTTTIQNGIPIFEVLDLIWQGIVKFRSCTISAPSTLLVQQQSHQSPSLSILSLLTLVFLYKVNL